MGQKLSVTGALLALVIIATSCSSENQKTQQPVTYRVAERDRDKDGQVDLRVETVWRGKLKVMQAFQSKSESGRWTGSRSFFSGGDMILTEADENGDGVFETIAVYNPATKSMEVFLRDANGGVKPVDGAELDIYKRQHEVLEKFWGKGFDARGEDLAEKLLKSAAEAVRAENLQLRQQQQQTTNGQAFE